MRPVNPVDQLFFWLERRNQPMHVGGLQLFKLPDDAPPDFVHTLVEELRTHTDIQPPFDQYLKYRFTQPFWDRDRDFDIEHHVRHLALPRPGRIRELLAVVSHAHSALLDRSRPLWECYVIEGVCENRVAIYYKMHHGLMDGVSAMRMCQKALATDPQDARLRAAWAMDCSRERPARNDSLSPLLQPLRTAGREAASLPGVARALYTNWHDRRHADYTRLTQAPRCILNQRITGSRRFAAQSYALAQVKALGKRYGATVNDIVLAMCASALRRYLQDLDALPEAPLVAMVPVSLHDTDDDYGNKVGMICASLATHMTDPVERLTAIRRSVDYWKQRYRQMTPEEVRNFAAAIATPAGLNLVSGLAPRRQAFNVVISNVPGPKQTLYARGAELQGMYPVSIVLDGLALNMTVVGYRDKLEFGLIACRRTLPGMQVMLTYLQEALDTLDTLDKPG